MWTTILKALGGLVGVLGSYFALKSQRIELKNAEDIQKRKEAQDEVSQQDEAEELVSDVATGNEKERQKALDEIRKRVAE